MGRQQALGTLIVQVQEVVREAAPARGWVGTENRTPYILLCSALSLVTPGSGPESWVQVDQKRASLTGPCVHAVPDFEDHGPEQGRTPAVCLLMWGHLRQKGRAF